MENRSAVGPPELTDPFWLRDWCVDSSTNRLFRGEESVRLEPRAMKVLICLAESAGKAVTREHLEEEVWRGMVVGYDSLSHTITKLRKAFGDDPSDPRFIETIPKVGYRLIPEVVVGPSDGELPDRSPPPAGGVDEAEQPIKDLAVLAASRGALLIAAFVATIFVAVWLMPWTPEGSEVVKTTIPSPLDKPSIAVLPFVNLGEDPEQVYFSDGITDDIITDLSKLSGLFVIARNSTFAYREPSPDVRTIARDLGVRYVLQGSVRKSENHVRINAQLVDASSGGYLWAERYDGTLSDLFILQDRVRERIVHALRVQLTPVEKKVVVDRGTGNLAAYDAFLKGWDRLRRKTPEDAVAAIRFFEQALTLDPSYGRAYAALAQAYWDNAANEKFYGLMDFLSADTSAGDVADPFAWKYLQKVQGRRSSQYHSLNARMLQRQRRFDEAMHEARRAVAVGPSDPSAYDALIEILIYSGQTEEAIELARSSIRLDPGRPGEKLFLQGMAHYVAGDPEEAVTHIDRARAHNPDQYRYAVMLAASLAELGRIEEAEVALGYYRAGLVGLTNMGWTALRWPFADRRVARRFSDALVKAGLSPMADEHYLVAAADRLTDREIRTLLAGRTMVGMDRGPTGLEDGFEVTRDDDAQIVRQEFLTYFTDGTSRIENNLLCDPWWEFGDYCVAIYRNPGGTREERNEYVFFTMIGVFTFSVMGPTG